MKKECKREDRHKKILSMLQTDEFLSSEQLVRKFGCSLSTVRNNLVQLEQQGLLVRSLGGAKATIPRGDSSIIYRLKEHRQAKQAIAEYVVNHYIEERSTVILDAGTTSLEVANVIAAQNVELTVLTSSKLIVQALAESPRVQLYSFGGFYNRESAYFFDDFFREQVKAFRADTYIMAVNGVSPEVGYTITFKDEAVIKNAWMDIASHTIAICDSSKVMRNSCRILTGFDKVPTMVTDSMISPDSVAKLTQNGLEVVIADAALSS